jgi:ribosomal protein RSM22 (predicted rRNA methylase)
MNPDLNKQLEEKAMIAVEKLLKDKSVKTNEDMLNSLLAIMKEGEKEFIKERGRPMSYSEMRNMYG